MGVINDIMGWVKKQCNNDDTCIMLSFILVGFLLCFLFNNQTSGLANLNEEETSKGESIGNNNDYGTIGLVPNERRSKSPPSIQKQVGSVGLKAAGPSTVNDGQKAGLNVTDATIFKPFDEVWNPGFMPVDLVFKGAESTSGVGPSQMGPMGPDRPMPPSTELGVGSAPTPGGGEAQDEVTLSLIYAPWCGHSKRMLPDYEKVKQEFDGKVINGKKINIEAHDATTPEGKEVAKKNGVKGFPTMILEKNGEKQQYNERSYDGMAKDLNNL